MTSLIRLTGLLLLLGAGAPAHAQSSAAPSTTAPNAVTPPDGVARGVIRPNRPVDSKMVTRPPTNQQHKMPVITPPATAR